MERKTRPYLSPKRDKYLMTALTMYKSGMSVRFISKKTGVSVAHIYRWISKFADETPKIEVKMDEKPVVELTSINIEDLSMCSAEEQIAKLKEALRRAELRADLYDEMINVAEAKFKVGIRKKAGAKQ